MDEKGTNQLANGNSATESLKREFKLLIPDLPKGWKGKMYDEMPALNTPKGATRLSKIRQGTVAPSLDELAALSKIIKESKPVKGRLSRQKLNQ